MTGLHDKETVRFTFDCPSDLHTVAKMKATALKQSMKDYVVSLLIKDAMENPPRFVDKKEFKKEMKFLLENDADLMQKLADK